MPNFVSIHLIFQGEIEVDESFFGVNRVKGKRGPGAYPKTPVFGLLQRGGKVEPASIIHSDSHRGYNGLVGLG